MTEDLEMILKMAGATLLYVVITALLWRFYRKRPSAGRGINILIGLIYGACSVTANHVGINYLAMILNVRDIGPLAAGLFFSPVSGIIAGLIGGIERILAGEIWKMGQFTEVACGLSTILAGFLSAGLHKWLYHGRRPSTIHSFFLGAVMEVFHMYAVLFTNRNSTLAAYYIVRTVAIPMILFTAIGLMLCSWIVRKLSGEQSDIGWHVKDEELPISAHFQRWLLVVTMGIFAFNFWTSYNFQTRLVCENASMDLEGQKIIIISGYSENRDLEAMKTKMEETQDHSVLYFLIEDKSGRVAASTALTDDSMDIIPAEQMEIFREDAADISFRPKQTEIAGEEGFYTVGRLDDDYLILLMKPSSFLYETRDSQLYENTLSDILLFTVLYMLVAGLVDNLVVKNLHRVNKSLNRITNGDLNETVWVHTSSEMKALSTDINKTVTALKGYIAQAEQKMKDELKMATAIQDAALPKNFNLPTNRVELYALMTPAREIGGDFYDFFVIGRDLLAFVIADVSGKGVPAALFMMRAKTAIKNYARSGNSPAELLENVNNILCEGNEAEMFVSVWLGILNPETGEMHCCNAGHEYPILMRAGGDYELVRDRHGLVLAAMENIHLKEYEIRMNPGDRLLVYTDGVPEAINPKEEAYGTERLVSKLNRLKNTTQKNLLESLLQDIRNFAGTAEQFDDITMLGITYLSESEQEKE